MSTPPKVCRMLSSLLLIFLPPCCNAGETPGVTGSFADRPPPAQTSYYWQSQPIENSAQLLTLFLHSHAHSVADVPVLSVLRDTLGDKSYDDDRLTSVWLLSYSPLTPMKRVFASIPFFYWRIRQGNSAKAVKHLRPFLDLTQPQNPLFYGVTRNLLQWTMLDPMTTPIRASSRAYRTNELDEERLHLEEAIGYLRHAPAGEGMSQLTQPEIDGVIARLELRKQLLGGLVADQALPGIGREGRQGEEVVRSRNWEMLRQIAERTGLFFEPLQLTGTNQEYAMLWFSPQASEPEGVSHKALWKLLSIRDPWTDPRLMNRKWTSFVRDVDSNGSLLPVGRTGAKQIALIPLGAYSMNYPRMPLLLIDFRDGLHIRRHEMTQRAITEVTSGVIGISHFTNWYFYVAADAYDFVIARHGGAVDQAQRLDSYSRFRVALALDEQVAGDLRSEMQRRVNAMAVNPLESSPKHEIQTSQARYQALQIETRNGRLANGLDKQRRAELANFGKTSRQLAGQTFLHVLSLGLYTDRVPSGPETVSALQERRRVESNLAFLEEISDVGTEPEVAYERGRLQNALRAVSSASPEVMSGPLQMRTGKVIRRFRSLTADPLLIEDCRLALHRVNGNSLEIATKVRVRAPILPGPVK